MAGKKLPRAIRITADEMRGSAAPPDLKLVSPLPETPRDRSVAGAAASPETVTAAPPRHAPMIEIAQAVPATAAATQGPDAARIKGWAQKIVHRHAAYSVLGGIIPLPVVNAASVAAVNVRMVKLLSELYAVPFDQGRARALVISLMGGILPSGIGTVTASALLYVIPGSTFIGLAMSSVTAAACTRGIGRVFIDHFASGATTLEVPIRAR